MEKKLLIVITGAGFNTNNVFSRVFGKVYCKLFSIEFGNNNWHKGLENYVRTRTKDIDIINFEWSHGHTKREIIDAAENLKKKINEIEEKEKYAEIILFGKSLGGTIIEYLSIYKFDSLMRGICVSSPLLKDLPNQRKLKIYNIYSNDDNYLNFIINFIPFCELPKKAKFHDHIEIPGLRHSDFNHNNSVDTKIGMVKLFDLYKDIIVNI